jgi:hypothetical protein
VRILRLLTHMQVQFGHHAEHADTFGIFPVASFPTQ